MQKYYGSLLGCSDDLQTSASSCSLSDCSLPKSVREALGQIHPEVTKKYGLFQSCLSLLVHNTQIRYEQDTSPSDGLTEGFSFWPQLRE